MSNYKIVLACAYCQQTHFKSIFDLKKHWIDTNQCLKCIICPSDCLNCSPFYINTKIVKTDIIEYLNSDNYDVDTYYSYYLSNNRHLYFDHYNSIM